MGKGDVAKLRETELYKVLKLVEKEKERANKPKSPKKSEFAKTKGIGLRGRALKAISLAQDREFIEVRTFFKGQTTMQVLQFLDDNKITLEAVIKQEPNELDASVAPFNEVKVEPVNNTPATTSLTANP